MRLASWHGNPLASSRKRQATTPASLESKRLVGVDFEAFGAQKCELFGLTVLCQPDGSEACALDLVALLFGVGADEARSARELHGSAGLVLHAQGFYRRAIGGIGGIPVGIPREFHAMRTAEGAARFLS